MNLTCADCGASIFNDMPDVKHPHEFIQAAEARGWRAPLNPPGPPTCPSCIAKGKT